MSYDQKQNRQRGMAVVTVLFIIAVLLVLASAMTTVVIGHSQMTVNIENRRKAYNAAESGLADVAARIKSGSLVASAGTNQSGSGSLPAGASYTWTVTFNPSAAATAAPNPLNPASSCNAVSATQLAPGPGCVAIAPGGVFITVTAALSGHNASVEAMASSGQNFYLGTKTIAVVGPDPSVPQAVDIYASDVKLYPGYPGSSTANDADVISNGNWYACCQSRVDGTVATVGSINQANAITKLTGVGPFPFPTSAALQSAQTWWIQQAKANNCYFGNGAMPYGFVVPRGAICYLNGSVSGASASFSILNDGGMLVVSRQFSVASGVLPTTSSPGYGYHLTLACKSTCDCHKQARVVVLSQGFGLMIPPTRIDAELQYPAQSFAPVTPEPRGVFYSPNSPLHVMAGTGGPTVFQGVIAAQMARMYAPVQVDACAKGAVIRMGGFGITAFGQY